MDEVKKCRGKSDFYFLLVFSCVCLRTCVCMNGNYNKTIRLIVLLLCSMDTRLLIGSVTQFKIPLACDASMNSIVSVMVSSTMGSTVFSSLHFPR